MDVGESVRCLTVDMLRALDPIQMGVVWGVSLRRGSAPYSASRLDLLAATEG